MNSELKHNHMEVQMLQRAAMNSVALMLCVIIITIVVTKHVNTTIHATQTMTQGEEAGQTSFDTNSENTINDITESLDSLHSLSEKYIYIDEKMSENNSIEIQDMYLDPSVQIIISGLKDKAIDYESIIRNYKGEAYSGKPFFVEPLHNYHSMEEELPTMEPNQEGLLSTNDNGNDFASNINIVYEYDQKNKCYNAIIDIDVDNVYVYSIIRHEDYFYINLDKPKDIYDKLIVVDFGHGGRDAGTYPKDFSCYEKDINLQIGLYLKEMLDKREDIKVYYTRTTDEKVYPRLRVNLANNLEADFFISIHCNASELEQPYGTEVLYKKKVKKNGLSSKELAEIFMDEVHNVVNIRNRGVFERSDVYIIGHADVPVALIETAYMSNDQDLQFLIQKENQKLVAEAIYKGILRSYERLDEMKKQ